MLTILKSRESGLGYWLVVTNIKLDCQNGRLLQLRKCEHCGKFVIQQRTFSEHDYQLIDNSNVIKRGYYTANTAICFNCENEINESFNVTTL